jgi:beta-glucosidase
VRFEDSAALAASYGFSAQRISISMPRVMTYTWDAASASLTWTANDAGIAHYKSVLAAYKEAGVKVAATMWHWDLPLAIEEAAAAMYSNKSSPSAGSGASSSSSSASSSASASFDASDSFDCHGGSAWLCFGLVRGAFADYAKLLMDNFADDVAWWITLNEPLTIVENGYAGSGPHAPGRCGDRDACFAGDDLTEPCKIE